MYDTVNYANQFWIQILYKKNVNCNSQLVIITVNQIMLCIRVFFHICIVVVGNKLHLPLVYTWLSLGRSGEGYIKDKELHSANISTHSICSMTEQYSTYLGCSPGSIWYMKGQVNEGMELRSANSPLLHNIFLHKSTSSTPVLHLFFFGMISERYTKE